MAGVSLAKVRKTYPGGAAAVHEMSLEIADREFVVLVGPSGCGKTTLLRMIAGLETPTAGEVLIGGRPVNGVAPKDRDIAMVFQNYAIYPHMTVYDNLAFGLRRRGVPPEEADRRVREAAGILGIDALLDRRPRALSGGQRQRVAVGRAIVREPKVFLFDEPLSNLDARLRVEMRKEIKLLHRRLQTTMLYVTHDQVEAMTLGERVCVMNAGRIEQSGAPLEVYDNPATRFVAAFLGSPPMNFLPGRLRRSETRTLFEGRGFVLALPEGMTVGAEAFDLPVELGVRPEDLADDPQAAPQTFIPGAVELVEALGNEQLVHVLCGEARIISRREAHLRAPPGAAQRLVPRPDRLCLFRADSGSRLDARRRTPTP